MTAESRPRADSAGAAALKISARAQPPLVAPRAEDPWGGPTRTVSGSPTRTPRFLPPSRVLVPPLEAKRVKVGKPCILSM